MGGILPPTPYTHG